MVAYNEAMRLEFSERLNRALDLMGYPQRGRAQRLREALPFKVSVNAIKKWLNGDSIPATARLAIVASIAGTTPHYLLTGEGNIEREFDLPEDLKNHPAVQSMLAVRGAVSPGTKKAIIKILGIAEKQKLTEEQWALLGGLLDQFDS